MTKAELLKIAKPILYNTEMVKAILEGRKTVTRRVINWDIVNKCDMETDGTLLCFEDEYGDHIRPEKLCRYQPGNILYVRETWSEWTDGYVYRAWSSPFPQPGKASVMKWHPSIHMPKEAARIFLKVKDVRVEQLKDITEYGAIYEGTEGVRCDHAGLGAHGCTDCMNTGWLEPPTMHFMYIWNSTIKKSDLELYGWDANPYVWVIEFERIKPDSEV